MSALTFRLQSCPPSPFATVWELELYGTMPCPVSAASVVDENMAPNDVRASSAVQATAVAANSDECVCASRLVTSRGNSHRKAQYPKGRQHIVHGIQSGRWNAGYLAEAGDVVVQQHPRRARSFKDELSRTEIVGGRGANRKAGPRQYTSVKANVEPTSIALAARNRPPIAASAVGLQPAWTSSPRQVSKYGLIVRD